MSRWERDQVREIRRFSGTSEQSKKERQQVCAKAQQMAKAGMKRYDIAKALKVSLSLVDRACVGIGVKKRKSRNKTEVSVTDEELAERIEALYAERRQRMETLSRVYKEESTEWDCLQWIRKQMETRGLRTKEAATSHGDKSQ